MRKMQSRNFKEDFPKAFHRTSGRYSSIRGPLAMWVGYVYKDGPFPESCRKLLRKEFKDEYEDSLGDH